MEEEHATLTTGIDIDYRGNSIMYVQCKNCGQPFTCQTYRPYNYCGYCGLRILWNEEET